MCQHRRVSQATRDALLDVAADAVIGRGWAQTRMAEVARAAGVSRQTLYNEFGSKDGIAAALTLREAERFLAGTEAALDEAHVDGPVAAVAAAVGYALRAAGEKPLLKAVLTEDASGLLPFLTTRGQPVLAAARASIGRYFTAHWPAVAPAELDPVADTVVRLTLSYIVLPPDDPDETAEQVAARVAAVVDRLLPPTPGRTAG